MANYFSSKNAMNLVLEKHINAIDDMVFKYKVPMDLTEQVKNHFRDEVVKNFQQEHGGNYEITDLVPKMP